VPPQKWLTKQLADKLVEPISGLARAITYFLAIDPGVHELRRPPGVFWFPGRWGNHAGGLTRRRATAKRITYRRRKVASRLHVQLI